jgi:hypothetical protein
MENIPLKPLLEILSYPNVENAFSVRQALYSLQHIRLNTMDFYRSYFKLSIELQVYGMTCC